MLKPVAAVGGALALAGAGAIGAVSLMENFVIAGIKGVDACDENPVGQVGPFKSTLSFQCTEGSIVETASGLTVDAQYASFRAPADLESVETGLFWPLFPNRNQYGQAEAFKTLPPGAPQTAEFESCEKSWDGATSAGVATFETLADLQTPAQVAAVQAQIAAGNTQLTGAGVPDYFQNGGTGINGFCVVLAASINENATLVDSNDCTNVVDFTPFPEGSELKDVRTAILTEIGPDAKSLVEVLNAWNTAVGGALTETISPLLGAAELAVQCQTLAYSSLASVPDGSKGAAYQGASVTPATCTLSYGVGGPAEATLTAVVRVGVLEATISGITGVSGITNLSDTAQLEKLVAKCNDQEEDLSAIETAQILLPAGAAAAGVAAILLFVAVATAKAPLVLAGGVLGLVGGVLTLVALLGVRNAPVYANVGGEVEDGDVEYKSGFGATLGLAGIGAPVVGGLLGIGSFFCGTGEEGGALSSKVDNTY